MNEQIQRAKTAVHRRIFKPRLPPFQEGNDVVRTAGPFVQWAYDGRDILWAIPRTDPAVFFVCPMFDDRVVARLASRHLEVSGGRQPLLCGVPIPWQEWSQVRAPTLMDLMRELDGPCRSKIAGAIMSRLRVWDLEEALRLCESLRR